MKRQLLLFFYYTITLSVFAQSVYRENNIKFDGEQEDKTYYLYGNKNNPSCHIKIDFFYPNEYADKAILEKIQSWFTYSFFGENYGNVTPKQAAKKYTKAFISQYKEDFESSGIFKKEELQAKLRGEDIRDYKSLYIYQKTIRNTILFNRGNVISQVINTYEYTGGAHGLSTTQGLNLDIETGNPIRYNDVFFDYEEDKISDLLLTYLLDKYKVGTKEELNDMGFMFDKITPSRNFVVNDQGITFIYGQYELGAYTLGIIELFVPYYYIYMYMKPDSAVMRLARRQ
ncbi:DUF3298 and DUF4163 domain-containing protein [Bacteroidales bacterium OttesenSCG-928-M11]|nr:DUF3298 and DUF4163 domain-containing protein [Bacteroidales bacterium OttesenSCG-928-M11]